MARPSLRATIITAFRRQPVMNRPGNPRLLKYWRNRYQERRARFIAQGLTTNGTPPKKRRKMFDDPMLMQAHNNAVKLERYNKIADDLHSRGLTTRGTVPKQPRQRHRHENFVKPYDPPSHQEKQRHWRRIRVNAYHNARYHRLAEQRRAAGLTTKGKPRQRGRISPIEQQWRQFRASLNIKPAAEILTGVVPESRAKQIDSTTKIQSNDVPK